MSGNSFHPRVGRACSRDVQGRRFDPTVRQLVSGHGNPDPLASELILTLLGTGRFLVEAMESVAEAHGLSMSRFGVLIRLWRLGRPLPLNEIAALCDTTARNMTGLIDGLEAAGLVDRGADPKDRRVTLVELTQPGRQLVAEHIQDHWRIQRSLSSVLDDGERRALIDLCLRLAHARAEAGAPLRPPDRPHREAEVIHYPPHQD